MTCTSFKEAPPPPNRAIVSKSTLLPTPSEWIKKIIKFYAILCGAKVTSFQSNKKYELKKNAFKVGKYKIAEIVNSRGEVQVSGT